MADGWGAASPLPGIVTPEAVVLELRLATLGSRVIAILLDLLIQLSALFLLLLGLAGVSAATSASLPGWVGVIVVTFLVFFVIFGYPAVLETVWNGKTVGKRALGIRVLTTTGAPIRFRHAAIRAALELVDFFIPPGGLVACASVLLTRDDQRLGDLAAGTLVVHERSAAPSSAPVWFPPPLGYEAFTSTLDVAGLDTEAYELVRSFLIRAHSLTLGARLTISRRLAVHVGRIVHQLPPPSMPDELFLACVAAAYQQRSLASVPPPPMLPPPTLPVPAWVPDGSPVPADDGGFAPPR
ncbi:MAG TPA: RDD family protein [Acidimicrobiales bacterium]|nr:RDD family protein [Acidimicrobiales bacterium]